MTKAHKTKLRRNRNALIQRMDPATVINKLVTDGFLISYDQGTILAAAIRETKVERLLDALELKYAGAYSAFLKALTDSEQQPHAALFEGECKQ